MMVGRPVAGAWDGRPEMAGNPLFWYWIGGVGRPVMVGCPMVLGVSGRPKNVGRPVGRGQREMRVSGRDFGRNLGILGSKLKRFCG